MPDTISPKDQCDATVEGRNGKPRQCRNRRAKGSKYCKRHAVTGNDIFYSRGYIRRSK